MKYLCHYGTPRHSGRYPWGSGKNPYQSKDKEYITIPKNNVLNRISEKNEKKKRDFTYVSMDPNDVHRYITFAFNGHLGTKNKNPNKLYKIEYINDSDIKILNGAKITRILMNTYGDTSVQEAYKKLEKNKYFDLKSIDQKREYISKESEVDKKNREMLARWMDNVVYKRPDIKNTLTAFTKKYNIDGFIDPEDNLLETVISPIVITNKNAIRKSKVDIVKRKS